MRSEYLPKPTVENLRFSMGPDLWLPFQIILETGLRVGDVAKLRHEDVVRIEGVPCLLYTAEKTGKDGVAQISEKTFEEIRARGRRGYVFKGRQRGTHITRQALYKRVKKAADRSGVVPIGVSPHSFRKNFAVALMHEEGLAAVREALQHSNDAVTRVYAYADTILAHDSDEPIRWRDLEMLVDYILARLNGG